MPNRHEDIRTEPLGLADRIPDALRESKLAKGASILAAIAALTACAPNKASAEGTPTPTGSVSAEQTPGSSTSNETTKTGEKTGAKFDEVEMKKLNDESFEEFKQEPKQEQLKWLAWSFESSQSDGSAGFNERIKKYLEYAPESTMKPVEFTNEMPSDEELTNFWNVYYNAAMRFSTEKAESGGIAYDSELGSKTVEAAIWNERPDGNTRFYKLLMDTVNSSEMPTGNIVQYTDISGSNVNDTSTGTPLDIRKVSATENNPDGKVAVSIEFILEKVTMDDGSKIIVPTVASNLQDD